MLFTEFTLAID